MRWLLFWFHTPIFCRRFHPADLKERIIGGERMLICNKCKVAINLDN